VVEWPAITPVVEVVESWESEKSRNNVRDDPKYEEDGEERLTVKCENLTI
jgi:hypothetical protein